jgi:NADH-quinone oxidoreductase subunit C/D
VTPTAHTARRELAAELEARFGAETFARQPTGDGVPTLWVPRERVRDVLRALMSEMDRPFRMLYDLTAIDERLRQHRPDQPASDFTVVYHLLSLDGDEDIRLKVALQGEFPSMPTITDLCPAANWYEREVWDMFGITFEGHPHLRRILMPPWWTGHPLRKEHPARATEMGHFRLPDDEEEAQQEMLRFRPEEWGLEPGREDTEHMFLNLGPNHPGTHGVLRIVLQLEGEQIVNAVPDIGYHHRAAEKMAERQTWHTYIPYTDRVDYLGGVMNNFPYVMAVERLAGIEVPDRVKVIRVLMAELFRIGSHLVWYGTFAQDVGQMSPVFYIFNDRERFFRVIEVITGARMHPSWFRIGGVMQDLPRGWEDLVRDFVKYLEPKLHEYDRAVMGNALFKARTQGVGAYTRDEAIAWGVTGPGLRATGSDWDLRKKRPYSGYDWFEFEVPTATRGDCYDRAVVRIEEMRQSLRIIEQCVRDMPAGPPQADHPLATPPPKARTLHDIETLITHFLNVTWGPVIPAGEAIVSVEATKGMNGYHLVSDGGTHSYRTRIRTPSFPHMQMLPPISRGVLISDLMAILGSMDYVLADIDR